MQTRDGWKKDLARLDAKEFDYYLRTLRDLRDAGFCLATPEIADSYFSLVGDDPEGEDEDSNDEYEPTWYDYLFDVGYSRNLCKIVELSPRRYVYVTHDRSESLFDAIRSCQQAFKAIVESGKQCWVMPVLDNEEMTSLTFEFIVGTADEVISTIKNTKIPA